MFADLKRGGPVLGPGHVGHSRYDQKVQCSGAGKEAFSATPVSSTVPTRSSFASTLSFWVRNACQSYEISIADELPRRVAFHRADQPLAASRMVPIGWLPPGPAAGLSLSTPKNGSSIAFMPHVVLW